MCLKSFCKVGVGPRAGLWDRYKGCHEPLSAFAYLGERSIPDPDLVSMCLKSFCKVGVGPRAGLWDRYKGWQVLPRAFKCLRIPLGYGLFPVRTWFPSAWKRLCKVGVGARAGLRDRYKVATSL